MKKFLPVILTLNFVVPLVFALVHFRARSVHAASNELYFLHTDHLDSTRAVTDKDGNVVARYDYYPYGSINNQQSTINNQVERLYTSQISDEDTGLYFYNSRYYNSALGTFISADPLQGPNRYAYVSGNPVNMVDPSGNMFIADGGGKDPEEDWLSELSYTPSGYGTEVGATTPTEATTVAHTPWDPYYQGEPDPAGFYKTIGGVAAASITAPLAVTYTPIVAKAAYSMLTPIIYDIWSKTIGKMAATHPAQVMLKLHKQEMIAAVSGKEVDPVSAILKASSGIPIADLIRSTKKIAEQPSDPTGWLDIVLTACPQPIIKGVYELVVVAEKGMKLIKSQGSPAGALKQRPP